MEKNKITSPEKLIIIGGSAGSLSALLEILPNIHEKMNIPVLIILHRKPSPDNALIELLSGKTSRLVKEVDEKEAIRNNVIYVAPAEYHLLIEKNKTFSLDASEKVNFSRPSIDVSFESGADAFRENLYLILLSGANADGVSGMEYALRIGSKLAVQSPDAAQVPFMPQEAIKALRPERILDNKGLADFINSL